MLSTTRGRLRLSLLMVGELLVVELVEVDGEFTVQNQLSELVYLSVH